MADAALATAVQSALAPAGAEAATIATLAWVLVAGAVAIFVATMVLLVLALRGRRALATPRLIGIAGVAVPLLVLSALLVSTYASGPTRDLRGAPDLVVDVVGQQWWWRVRYRDADGALAFETANEIRIPVGATVELRLTTADVLHAFWVPALAGKLDMIPGRANRMRLAADAPGTYRGQCAEYCGGPHGFMAFLVIAKPPAEFEAWAARQREPAPEEAQHAQGASLFAAHCAACHAVRGTAAGGSRGPDLTHVGGRSTIGAGRLPMNAGTLAAWIASGQRLKPGNLMPQFEHFPDEELRALAGYLESLR